VGDDGGGNGNGVRYKAHDSGRIHAGQHGRLELVKQGASRDTHVAHAEHAATHQNQPQTSSAHCSCQVHAPLLSAAALPLAAVPLALYAHLSSSLLAAHMSSS
jgi:hypothetical protein